MTFPPSDGRSTVYSIGDDFCAVNNGQPYVDADGCWWSATHEEGWSGLDAPRQEVLKNPVSDGQQASNLLNEAKSIILGGTVRAPDQLRLQAAIDNVTALLAGDVRLDTLTVAEPHLRRNILVRRDQKTQVAKVSPFTAVWLLGLIADKPLRLGDALTAATHLPLSTGGWTFPFTFPLTIASTVVSGTCSLVNPGNTNGPVTMRIDGPVTGPIITHRGTGAQLVLASSLTLAAGEWLDIDMDNHTVLANGTASRNGYITQRGWSAFEKGANVWAFSAISYNPAALLTVTATPAWL
jgi:hypothetical protein